MKAAIYHGIGKVSIEEKPVPKPGPTDLVIKNEVCGVCGTDVHGFFTEEGAMAYYDGCEWGHEFSGTVVEVGSEVKDIPIGMRVCVSSLNGHARTMKALGPMGAAAPCWLGGYSEFALIEEAAIGFNIFPLADSVSWDDGALCEIYSVGLHGLDQAMAKPGDRVLILGAGPTGLALLVGAKARGIEEVIVSDLIDFRLRKAKELGASAVHNAGATSLREFVEDRYGASPNPILGPIDVVCDCAGVPKATAEAIALTSIGGRVSIVGSPSAPVSIELGSVLFKEVNIRGSMGSAPAQYAEVLRFREAGKGDLRPMITHRFAQREIAAAFQMTQKADQAIKVVIDHSL